MLGIRGGAGGAVGCEISFDHETRDLMPVLQTHLSSLFSPVSSFSFSPISSMLEWPLLLVSSSHHWRVYYIIG